MIKSIAVPAGLLVGLAACSHTPAYEDAAPYDHTHLDAEEVYANKIVLGGTGESIENPFHPVHLLLSATESAGSVTIYEFDLPPNSPGSPPHSHSLEDEYFFVISGSLDVLVDGQVQRLQSGDFAALTRGHTHMFWNGSDTPTKFLMTTTGASFEAFMANAAPRLAAAEPKTAQDAGAVIGQLAAEHGITIVMDQMPVEAAPLYMPSQDAD